MWALFAPVDRLPPRVALADPMPERDSLLARVPAELNYLVVKTMRSLGVVYLENQARV